MHLKIILILPVVGGGVLLISDDLSENFDAME